MNAARRMLGALLAFVAAAAQAAAGLAELPGQQGDLPVTVFYPTAAAAATVTKGPFTLQVAENAAPARGNGRLVVLSHGSGGSPWVHADLALALAEAGFVAALPTHRGDNFRDTSAVGPASWRRRPAEVARAIDAVARDPRFGPLLAADKVGAFGMSAGGHTVLTLAGGRWSPAGLARHCEARIREDFPACVGLATELRGDFFDHWRVWSALAVIRWRFSDPGWQVYRDPRIAAVVAAVPYAAAFDMASLAEPRVPLGLVTAAKDLWLAPRFHAEAVLAACGACERVAHLPGGGHGALLSPLPPELPPRAARLLADPPGFDRAALGEVHRRIVAFFRRHLLP